MNDFSLVIQNATLKNYSNLVDIGISGGKIAKISAGNTLKATEVLNTHGGYVSPSFVDPHFHLDKTMSRDLFGATTFNDAFNKAHEIKCSFTAQDVAKRAKYALEQACCNGIGAIKAQVDVDFATGLTSLEGVMLAVEQYKDFIDVELVAFPQEGILCDKRQPDLLKEALKMGCKYVGGLPEFEKSMSEEDQKQHISMIFDLAQEFDVDIDSHADYTDSSNFKTLEMIADETIKRGMQGRVCVDHCAALAVYDDEYAKKVIEKIAFAEINVIVLPIANLQMLGGMGRTPLNRGSSRILELLDAGVNVSAGSDNMYDIWYRFNGMDPILTALLTCLSGGMRTDDEVGESFEMVTSRAARTIKGWDKGVIVGAPADLCVHTAKSIVDIYRMVEGKRTVIKNGRIIAGTEKNIWKYEII